MTISLKKWKGMTDQERVEYLRKGSLKVEPRMGIRADSKVGDNKSVAIVSYLAKCRGIVVGTGTSEDEAYRSGQKWLSEYDGKLPEEEEEAQGDSRNNQS